MKKLKCYVLTVSKTFPKGHKRAGEPTDFMQKIKDYEKIHTIRGNYPLWAKRFEEIEAGRAYLSVRQWSGKPYASKQEEIFRYDNGRGIGVQRLEDGIWEWCIDGNPTKLNTADLANNDGLTYDDFLSWFGDSLEFNEPAAIIHFSDFRY